MNRIQSHLLSVSVDCLTMEGTLNVIKAAIHNKEQIHHSCVNAGKLVEMRKNSELFNSVASCNLINADGMAVVWASRLLTRNPIPERVAGIDLMEKVIEMAHHNGYKVFFFGAKQEILEKTINYYTSKYSKNIVAGSRNGYFNEQEEIYIAKDIADSGAQILFVAISTPIKENFLYRFRDTLANVSLIMGVGGSFDVVSGKIKRAPLWAQNNGLEWLYRLVQEPGKLWKRYLFGNFIFIGMVVRELFEKLTKILFNKQ